MTRRLLEPAPLRPDEVRDLIERTRAARRPPIADAVAEPRTEIDATRDRVLAAAQALDIYVPSKPAAPLPQFPPGSLCAICTRPAIGALHREPLGRGDALVNVCSACATETPLERDHLFGSSDRPGTGLGAGNRHAPARKT